MRFEVLGPVRAFRDTGVAATVSDLRRRLLAVLLVRANSAVGVDVLTDVLWHDDPPERPTKSLQIHVFRLRQVLDRPDRLKSVPQGYLLEVGPGELDALDFESLQAEARRARQSGDLEAAVGSLRAALALWWGAPYAELDDGLIVGPEARRLAEARLIATEELYEAELARGRAREVVPELTELVAEFPLRERFIGQLMLALYRSGRQARALTAFRAARQRLARELGAEPGRELRELHDAIRAEDPALLREAIGGVSATVAPRQSAAAWVPPGQLPPVPGSFVGRDAELAELDRVTDAGDAAVILTTGMAGVGKTGLVVRYAHQVAERFGDGQLYLDLRGHSVGPAMEPTDALAHLLRGLGADPHAAGTSVEAATAEYRSLVAGRKMLVVLDNVASADQVRPLLPASPGCLTLVTSRNRLPGLVAREGARRIALDVLPANDAEALLTRLLGPERVLAEPENATALVEACAGLPLALRIAAAQLADEPHRHLTDYLAEFRDRGLAALALDDDAQSAVAAAFDLSYQRLGAETRRLFRLLGVVPGLDVTVDAVAALSGGTSSAALETLRRLVGAHLLAEHAAGRYRFHDLLRDYARDRADTGETAEDRLAAVQRLFTWYYFGKEAAWERLRTRLLHPPRPTLSAGVRAVALADGHDAVSWLRDEFANLAASVRAAENDERLTPWTWHLALGVGVPMARRGFSTEVRSMLRSAVEAARTAGDRHAIAHALTELGAVETLADIPVPDELVTEVLAHAKSVGDLAVQGYCLHLAGVVKMRANELEMAEEFLFRSLAVHRQIDDQDGQGSALNFLGGIAQHRGDLREALHRWEQILELDEGPATRSALQNLATTRRMLGQLDGIDATFDAAEALIMKEDDKAGACFLMLARSEVRRATGQVDEAIAQLLAAQELAFDLGIRRLQVEIGAELGFCRLGQGAVELAMREFERAADVASSAGLRAEGADAARGLAETMLTAGDLSTAESHASAALALAGEGQRIRRGEALVTLSRVALAADRVDEAVAHAESALEIQRSTEHYFDLARAHQALGEALLAGGSAAATTRGAGHLREALRMFETFGSPEAHAVRAALAPRGP